MSVLVLHDALITVNGVDLSEHCTEIVIEDEAEDVTVTSFSPFAYESDMAGFKDVAITATFFQDFAASVHAVLQPLYDSAAPFDVTVVPEGSVPVSVTNPRFVLTARLLGYDPLSAMIGEAPDIEVEFVNASVNGLTVDDGPLPTMFFTVTGVPDPDDYLPGSEWIEVVE